MPLILAKLLVTPILVGGSTFVARRWGPSVGGWLISLPLTSGPILVFVAIDHGPAFAASTAVGSLAGLAAIALYCIGYARAARVYGPIPSLTLGTLGFAAGGVLLQPILGGPIWPVAIVVFVAVVAASRLIPASRLAHAPVAYPRWDLPARMAVATALVLAITAAAPSLGPHLSGLVATFPVYLSVLVAFTHLHSGPTAATDVLRGLRAGLYGTAAFFLVIHFTLGAFGLAVAVVAAIAAALGIGGATLRVARPRVEPEPA